MTHIKPLLGIAFLSIVITFCSFLSRQGSEISENKNDEKNERSSGALESMQFLSQMRAFPNKDIPDDKYFKAFEYSKNNIQEYSNGDSPTQWSSIGPNNVGGRTLTVAISPADTGTIYLGAASGGLWKSITGGIGASAWTQINTGYPSLAVSSIAIDSVNPNVMYIGTGETYGYQYSLNGLDVRVTRGMYGIGILKTTDGGTTWTKTLDWSYDNKRGIWRVKINPKNSNTVYSATTEGVYKTNNAGATWTQVLNYHMVMDMQINPVDTSVVYVSVGDLSNDVANPNVGIYKTTNSGATWTKLTSILPTFWSGKASLDLFKGNPNNVYVSIGNDPSNPSNSYLGMYVSTDAGATFTLKYNNPGLMTNQGWYNNAFLVKANDQNTMVLGNLNLYKSVNGGTTFAPKSDWSAWNSGATPPGAPEGPNNFVHADHHFYLSNPIDPNKLYITADGGLYRSNDFGETFYSCNGGYATSQFYNGFSNSYQDSIFCIGGLQDNRSVFYQGTTAWYKTFGGDGFWCGVNSLNSSTCYTEYTTGDINKSVNGGITWSDISSGLSGTFCFSSPYIVCRSNPNVLYIAGNNIFKSTTGGGGWVNVGTFPYNALSMDASSTGTDTVYVGVIPFSAGVPAAIYRSTNGATFANISGSALPSAYPTDIHVNPNNSADVLVTLGGFGNGHVYHSTDAGVTWANITGNLPDVPHQSVIIDPLFPQNIYVGNDFGVYVTVNNGTSWSTYAAGMPYAMIFDLKIVYPNRHIRAATYGNGVFERSLVQNPVGITPISSQIPKSFSLSQNYPNPFNPSTKIHFEVPLTKGDLGGFVKIIVYDALGKEVSTLVNENLKPGSYEAEWNAFNEPSGIYFYKLTAQGYSETKKMILIK